MPYRRRTNGHGAASAASTAVWLPPWPPARPSRVPVIPRSAPSAYRCARRSSPRNSPDQAAGAVGSAHLADADQVARGVPERAVANPVRLIDRLLDDFGAAGLQPFEGAVEVGGGEGDVGVAALGHHLSDGAALFVGDAASRRGGRFQDDRRARLAGGADRDPAHSAVSDVVANLEAEGVAIEGQGRVWVVVREKRRVNGDAHNGHARYGSVTGASRFLIGLVTCFATHGGIPTVACAASRR